MSDPFVCTGCEQTAETFKPGACSQCDENYVFTLLPLCGCGDPDAVRAVYLDVLRDCGSDAFPRPFRSLAGWPSEAQYVLLYSLDEAGLIEHGGTVYGSWLTDRGRLALAVLGATPSSEEMGRGQ